MLGLLHDIGRFEQARRFHTFIDYKSMDHARYGVWYLFEQGHIRDFLPDPEPERDRILELAILWHNAYAVPAGVIGKARDFALLLRDADKIDLFRVYAGYLDHPEQVWQVSLEDLGSQAISPGSWKKPWPGNWSTRRRKRRPWTSLPAVCASCSISPALPAWYWSGSRDISGNCWISSPAIRKAPGSWIR